MMKTLLHALTALVYMGIGAGICCSPFTAFLQDDWPSPEYIASIFSVSGILVFGGATLLFGSMGVSVFALGVRAWPRRTK